jgi:hypothetical protein
MPKYRLVVSGVTLYFAVIFSGGPGEKADGMNFDK